MLTAILVVATSEAWSPLGNGLDQPAIITGFALFFIQTFFVWFWVRGSSRALRYFIIGSLSGLMMSPCLSWAFWVGSNGYNDSNITVYERQLRRTQISQSDDSTTYYFYFDSVPGVEDSTMKLVVRSSVFKAGNKGDMYDLTVGAGNLETPWLKRLSRQEPQPE